jgi:hypothetical protein
VNDRKVLGSIVEIVRESQFWLTEREMSPFDAACRVNETTLSYLRYNNPKEIFTQLQVSPPKA